MKKKPPLYDTSRCFLCGTPYVEVHHIYPSSRRPISDREGCVVALCHEHHQGRHGVHSGDRTLDRYLKRDCQVRWERREGVPDGDHAAFVGLFGRNYITEDE